MKKLIFHVGLNKCGSTTIQNYIHTNSTTLLNSGVLVPKAGTSFFKTRHFDFFRYEGKEFKSLCDELAQEVERSKCDVTILSEESINKKDLDKYSQFKNIFDEIKIVMYIRRQDLLMESYYNQQIKTPWNYKASIESPKNILTQAKELHWLDYYSLAESFSNIFEKGNIVIIPFEKQQLPESLGYHFLSEICDVNLSRIKVKDTNDVTNTSVPYSSLGLLAEINRHDMNLLAQRGPVRDFIHNIVRENFKDYSKYVLILEQRKQLLSEFEEGNKKIAVEYLGRKDGRLFYEPLPNDNSETQQLMDLDMSSMVSKVFVPMLRGMKDTIEKDRQLAERATLELCDFKESLSKTKLLKLLVHKILGNNEI